MVFTQFMITGLKLLENWPLADISLKSDYNEMKNVEFVDYGWEKWKK